MSSLPPDFWTVITLLAKACSGYERSTGRHAVIVGGAAVAFYTQGKILSGDFDLVADVDFEQNLLVEGFQKEDEPGRLLGGWFHPDAPRFSVELVSGNLFDGRADKARILAVQVLENASVLFAPIEDMVADRLGQFAASKNTDKTMLEQARLLMELAPDLDVDYLLRRIREETGDPSLVGLV